MSEISNFFDLREFEHRVLFENCENVWEVLAEIKDYICEFSKTHNKYSEIPKDFYIDENNYIYIGKNTVIEPGAYIKGPCIIGDNCEIRTGAYIRENVIVGNNTVIGHASELKNTVVMNNSALPHYNYAGDSVIGNGVNLGCGCVIANLPLRSIKDPVTGKRNSVKIKTEKGITDTGLSKLGAVIGDMCQIGCQCVLNPGTFLEKECIVYPNVCLKSGFYGYKNIIRGEK